MNSGTKIRQSLKCFQNTQTFFVGKRPKAGEEVVFLGYEEVGLKLGGAIAKFTAALDSIQPKGANFINLSLQVQC